MRMSYVIIWIALAGLLILASCAKKAPEPPIPGKVMVFRAANCGCCSVYADYLKKRGVDMELQTVPDMQAIKNNVGVPAHMLSCHTSKVDGYYIEGHVPVEAIQKLLGERPDIAGIAMPGMPSGSPGMPGSKNGPFVIYAVKKDGSVNEFMRL